MVPTVTRFCASITTLSMLLLTLSGSALKLLPETSWAPSEIPRGRDPGRQSRSNLAAFVEYFGTGTNRHFPVMG